RRGKSRRGPRQVFRPDHVLPREFIRTDDVDGERSALTALLDALGRDDDLFEAALVIDGVRFRSRSGALGLCREGPRKRAERHRRTKDPFHHFLPKHGFSPYYS